MDLKRPLIASSILHALLFLLLLSGIDWSWDNRNRNLVPIEARLLVKNQKNKDYLPKKKKPPPSEHKTDENLEKKPEAQLKTEHPLIAKEAMKKNEPTKVFNKPSHDYAKDLASLSQSFAQELSQFSEPKAESEPEGDVVNDQNYFDQVYSLIKESFVVPPHLNGPQGQGLEAVLRIFLAPDGSLNKLDLVSSSGDEHFDKAVMEGTKRVNNFGSVPVFLQEAMRERGIVVELCPIKCRE